MKYQILAGPARSGKTTELCKWILDQADQFPDRRFIMVVPEQVSNAYEKKLIMMNDELHNKPGFLNVDVLGFNRLAYRIFGELGIQNTQVMEEFEKHGMMCVGRNPESDLVEIVEIPGLKWYIGTQYHPEYQSTVLKPHPLFMDFVKTAIENKK